MQSKDFYQRKLPHWNPAGQVFFITFRLANSLPAPVIQALSDEQEQEKHIILSKFSGAQQHQELYNLRKRYFGQFDSWLDRCITESPRWLAQESIARIVSEQIHIQNGIRYRLIAFCIMSNHVHLLIDTADYHTAVSPPHNGPTATYPLADTLKLLKGRTARYCNQALERSGTFWHHESYDHVVRDEKEYEHTVAYILNNPVKAGLVENWEDWPFTYFAE
jgi:putative transposase